MDCVVSDMKRHDAFPGLLATLLLAVALPAHGARGLSDNELARHELTGALKQLLVLEADKAVRELGRKDGFLNNPKARIELPEPAQRVSKGLRRIGADRYSDDLVLAMNRAAESTMSRARSLLLEAIDNMTVEDGSALLKDGSDSLTRYFRNKTQAQLTGRLLPIVQETTKTMHVAEAYNKLSARAAKFGLLRPEDAHLDDYITGKAIEALFEAMAAEERAIRANPTLQTQKSLRKVFGTPL
jgi:hypothetical protein